MIKNYENTKRSKHIDIKVHFIKFLVYKGKIKLMHVLLDKNIVNVFSTISVSRKNMLVFS